MRHRRRSIGNNRAGTNRTRGRRAGTIVIPGGAPAAPEQMCRGALPRDRPFRGTPAVRHVNHPCSATIQPSLIILEQEYDRVTVNSIGYDATRSAPPRQANRRPRDHHERAGRGLESRTSLPSSRIPKRRPSCAYYLEPPPHRRHQRPPQAEVNAQGGRLCPKCRCTCIAVHEIKAPQPNGAIVSPDAAARRAAAPAMPVQPTRPRKTVRYAANAAARASPGASPAVPTTASPAVPPTASPAVPPTASPTAPPAGPRPGMVHNQRPPTKGGRRPATPARRAAGTLPDPAPSRARCAS